MTSVVIVCSAGASSTFLAHKMNRRAADDGLPVSVQAATQQDYLLRLRAGNVLLVGPQLGAVYEDIRLRAEELEVRVGLLPGTIFGPGGVEEALRIVAELATNDENGRE
jgi:Phosphotransferase system cellobiose-specific component IIB